MLAAAGRSSGPLLSAGPLVAADAASNGCATSLASSSSAGSSAAGGLPATRYASRALSAQELASSDAVYSTYVVADTSQVTPRFLLRVQLQVALPPALLALEGAAPAAAAATAAAIAIDASVSASAAALVPGGSVACMGYAAAAAAAAAAVRVSAADLDFDAAVAEVGEAPLPELLASQAAAWDAAPAALTGGAVSGVSEHGMLVRRETSGLPASVPLSETQPVDAAFEAARLRAVGGAAGAHRSAGGAALQPREDAAEDLDFSAAQAEEDADAAEGAASVPSGFSETQAAYPLAMTQGMTQAMTQGMPEDTSEPEAASGHGYPDAQPAEGEEVGAGHVGAAPMMKLSAAAAAGVDTCDHAFSMGDSLAMHMT
jgi:hypothetical protein